METHKQLPGVWGGLLSLLVWMHTRHRPLETGPKHTLVGEHSGWLIGPFIPPWQVGPGLVFLIFQHPFLGRGIMFHSITPVEPLLQHVIHRLYYQRNIPALVPKFILWAESVQVSHGGVPFHPLRVWLLGVAQFQEGELSCNMG